MRVVVFGNVPLASWVIGTLNSRAGWELAGVVCKETEPHFFAHHGMALPAAHSYCHTFGIPVLDMKTAEAIAEEAPTLGVSVRYPELFKRSFYEKFQPGIVNLHGGLLPVFRGVNIANHAILDGAAENGGTIHFVAEGVDTGDIVVRRTFTMSESDTAKSVFDKTLHALKLAFVDFLQGVEQCGQIKRVAQREFMAAGEEPKTYRLADLREYREVHVADFQSDVASRKVRAFTFPGQEPAYICIDGKKYWLTESPA